MLCCATFPVSIKLLKPFNLFKISNSNTLDLSHCSKRFNNAEMNPLLSLCSDRQCYERSYCRPNIVDTHLVRSKLFWIQIYAALIHALPLDTAKSSFSDLMSKISHEQAGFRSADQIDISGIFRNLQKKFKDARPSDQSVMDRDIWIMTGNNQVKLKRDVIVSKI